MNYALEARCKLAISRVLAPYDAVGAARKLTEARSIAIEEGFSGSEMSALIESEDFLKESFMAGLIGHQSQQFGADGDFEFQPERSRQ